MAMIIIRKYYNYIQANMALGLLQSQDILSYLENEYTSTIYPIGSALNGGINLLVNQDDAAAAEEILRPTEEKE